jgi:hypothetical protein
MVGIGALMAVSLATALSKNGLSTNIFICSTTIGLAVMVWIGIFPTYFVLVSVLMLVGMFFSGRGTGSDAI